MSALLTPCHNAPLIVTTVDEGGGYYSQVVPDTIYCAADGCSNSWNADGTVDYYKSPESALSA